MIYKILAKLVTKKLKSVPLFIVSLNYNGYKKGINKNCVVEHHPMFENDESLNKKFKEIIDYIRENYDMEDII